jgi:hypothetical protein
MLQNGVKVATNPVATIRLLRTRIAPTRRFMQLDRSDAREAKRMK